ncbi:MAG: phosphoribosylamine--glycine ligase [Calditrichia bacterium]
MNILVIGSGGREHALTWKILQSSLVDKIYCIPGNAGMAELAECVSLPISDFGGILEFIRMNKIDLTVVGPEQPLVEGLADFLTENGQKVFGPGRAAAQMEGSKVFAKELMQKYGIPTAAFGRFDNLPDALHYIDRQPEGPIVVKADGLAAGKGAIVCQSLQEARQAARDMLEGGAFKEAGSRVVIEEFMEGEEASLFVLTDGTNYRYLPPAQDFKRALDGDRGKNTGGMGSYAPTPLMTPEMIDRTLKEVVEPTLSALRSEGIVYKGVLYCGLMITKEGPKVVEFNCRFGDPETQVVLPLLKSDLVEIMLACAENRLQEVQVEFNAGYAVCVIAASGGYPESYEKGKKIAGLSSLPEDILLFHAGTKKSGSDVLTNGGRVLAVTATGATIKEAAEKAYKGIGQISFDGMFYRKDIAKKAIERFEY